MLDFVQEVARLLDKPVPTRETPLGVVKAVAAVGSVVGMITGREPSVTPEMAAAFSRETTATAAKAQRDLGFRVVPLKAMIEDCHDWMVAEKRL